MLYLFVFYDIMYVMTSSQRIDIPAVTHIDQLDESEQDKLGVLYETYGTDEVKNAIDDFKQTNEYDDIVDAGYEKFTIDALDLVQSKHTEIIEQVTDAMFFSKEQTMMKNILDGTQTSKLDEDEEARYDHESVREHLSTLDDTIAQIINTIPDSLRDERGELAPSVVSKYAKLYTKKLIGSLEEVVNMTTDVSHIDALTQDILCSTFVSGKKAHYHNTANKLVPIRRKGYLNLCEQLGVHPDVYMKVSEMANIVLRRGYPKNDDEVKMFESARGAKQAVYFDFLIVELDVKLRAMAESASGLQTYADDVYKLSGRRQREIDNAITDRIEPVLQGVTESDTAQLDIYEIEESLDWEVLPPGSLEETAKAIVRDSAERSTSKPTIDLNRLNILEGVRQAWGGDSYYSRGTRKARSVVRGENGEEQPDEYIILVLQERNEQTGEIMFEHAVAESPIAGPNAMYVYRQDATDHGHDWRTVMSLPKKQSRELGARQIFHTTGEGQDDLNKTMIEKAEHLLTVNTNDFNDMEFNGFDREGNVRTRIRRQAGKVALARL